MKQQSNRLFSDFQVETKALNSQELFVEQETCWRTNLLLQCEVERVKQRRKKFHKRTSFQQNIINEHIGEMLKVVSSTGLKILTNILPNNDKLYSQSYQSKKIEAINQNQYLTEQQKYQVTEAIFASQQNFSILMRLTSVFIQNKDELVYLLCQILQFSTVDLHVKEKYTSKIQTLVELMDKNKAKLMDKIMGQEIIKVINPLFFSNVNEVPLMRIVEAWFYHTLCIKQGLYGDNLKFYAEVQESHFEEQNYFQM